MKPETLRCLEGLRDHLRRGRLRYAVRFAWGRTGAITGWDAFTRA